jgi:hypothetical protein
VAATFVQSGTMPSIGMTQGTTVYSCPVQTRINQSATESTNQRTIRVAGTYSQMWVRVFSNGVSAATTVRFRVNAGNGNQTVSVNAGTTGEFIDASNSDAVIATDEVAVQFAVGAGGTTFNPCLVSFLFAADVNTYCPHGPGTMNISGGADSTTYYFTIAGGFNSLNTTEANVQTKMKSGGTLKNFFMSVATNGRSTDTIYRSRKNGADGNLIITVTAATTGFFEDTSNSDTYAADDLLALSGTTSTGGGNVVAQGGVGTESTDGTMPLIGGALTSIVVNAATTNYLATSGHIATSTTEAETRGQINVATTASKLEIYLSANTVSADSTFRLRVNGADVNQSVTITASTTGWFEDASNSDVIASGDELAYSLVTGATGTSMTIQTTAMLLTMAVAGGSASGRSRLTLLGVN